MDLKKSTYYIKLLIKTKHHEFNQTVVRTSNGTTAKTTAKASAIECVLFDVRSLYIYAVQFTALCGALKLNIGLTLRHRYMLACC